MNRSALLAGAASLMLAGPALAQTTTQSGSASRAVAIVNNQIPAGSPAQAQASDPSSTVTVHNTPDVAVAFASGNACAVGGGAGVSFAGVGITGVFSGEASDCTRRNWAIFLAELGIKSGNTADIAWATRLACVNEDVRNTAPANMCPQPVVTSNYGRPVQVATADPIMTSRCATWAPIVSWHQRYGIAPSGDETYARSVCNL